MRLLLLLHARRLVFSLGLLGLLGLASGCSDPDPVAALGKEGAEAKGKAQQEARQKQFGPSGAPTGKPQKKG
jgi:hypothetical protein